MKYLLNLPLGLAALLQAWFTGLVLMPGPWAGWSDGPSHGAMGLVMLEPVAFAWLLLLRSLPQRGSLVHSTGFRFTADGGSSRWRPAGRSWS